MTTMGPPAEANPTNPSRGPRGKKGRRLLFLDDDPGRAEIFLAEHPEAVWVETVAECVARLAERWDEVHLDHDLGGERFVDFHREDCGMEVVRWLCLEPRPHLKKTRFFVHTHNPAASCVMVMQMMITGYHVEERPFGMTPLGPGPAESLWGRWILTRGLFGWLRGLRRRPVGPGPEPEPGPDTK